MDIDEVLSRGVEKILPDKKGLASLLAKRKIKLYQGFDPSMPSLHLGNFVGLMKLRAFQKLGHEVIFLVGDFTGMIGDPTDKATTRKQLTREEVTKNAKLFIEQARKVLDFDGKNPAILLFNSEWNDKVTFKDLIEITSNFTVQQMIERDMFQERLKKNEPIYLHEFLYPVAQAYDSVVMEVDLEVGGNDQLFNLMAGRNLMRSLKHKEKYVLATKLLVDKEGNKVGKTTGNALFLDSTPENFYAGVMSFPDETIELGFELLTEVPMEGIAEKVKGNPMTEKKKLAFEIVKLLWGEESAKKSQKAFEQTFQERAPEFNIKVSAGESLIKTITPFSNRQSASAAKELIKNGAIDVNGKVAEDGSIEVKSGDEIKVGSRTFLKAK